MMPRPLALSRNRIAMQNAPANELLLYSAIHAIVPWPCFLVAKEMIFWCYSGTPGRESWDVLIPVVIAFALFWIALLWSVAGLATLNWALLTIRPVRRFPEVAYLCISNAISLVVFIVSCSHLHSQHAGEWSPFPYAFACVSAIFIGCDVFATLPIKSDLVESDSSQ